jgi:hypothetical protein
MSIERIAIFNMSLRAHFAKQSLHLKQEIASTEKRHLAMAAYKLESASIIIE